MYKRMYETRYVRPYYSIAHIGCYGRSFFEFTGFQYKDIIYVISKEMNNAAYFNDLEMDAATGFFRDFWQDNVKTKKLLEAIKNDYKNYEEIEKYGWQQLWHKKEITELISDAEKFYLAMHKSLVNHIVSQPQHIRPLEEKLNNLVGANPDRDKIIVDATYFDGIMPWAAEESEISTIHSKWHNLSGEEQTANTVNLAKKYGWIAEVESGRPFEKDHYKEKIINYQPQTKILPGPVPDEIKEIGKLIGELGFLRFWSRYHLQLLRYHLSKVISELNKKLEKPELELATLAEINNFIDNGKIDLAEITARKNGYAAIIQDGEGILVASNRYAELVNKVAEEPLQTDEIKGNIANKGKERGTVRVISFSSDDYNKQIDSFKEGEILVTGMTRPQIVHLCRKAAAIITDEGGITSHAAVVSREFNIPCIISTHNATKILKTGDFVEVDAYNGIIRKIK